MKIANGANDHKIGNRSLLLYGSPKVGLSTLAAEFPDPLFLNLRDDLSRMKVKEIKITDWTGFINAGAELSQGKHSFKTLVLAHIEDLWSMLTDHITKSSNQRNGTAANNLSELSYGDWRQALQIFEEKLDKLFSLGNVVLLSHEVPELRNIRGLERTCFTINLERKASMIALGKVEATGRLFVCEQDLRILSFLPTEYQVTGSRIQALLENKFVIREGEPPEFIHLLNQRSPEEKTA
jgi:hypothetical protein